VNDEGVSVAADVAGNVYIVGEHEGDIDFGGGVVTGDGLNDIFLVKLTPAGAHAWSKSFGDAANQQPREVELDSAGNVLIAGDIQGITDFGGGPLTTIGGNDVVVAKFSAAGAHVWSNRFGLGGTQIGHGLAVDKDNNVLLAGYFNGMIDLGSGPITAVSGGNDAFVAKLDPMGAPIWSKVWGAQDDQLTYAVAADAAGNVLLTGRYNGAVDFGGGPIANAGLNDVFVLKLDPAGAHAWSKGFGDAADQYGFSIVADAAGGAVIAGYFQGSIDFGGGPHTSAGGKDVFVARFTP
jgi:hypothetical protein